MNLKEIEDRLSNVNGEGVLEKVIDALSQIDSFLLQSTVSLEAKDIEGAESAVKEARALMIDIDVLTQDAIIPSNEVPGIDGEGSTTTSTSTGNIIPEIE